MSAYQYCVVPTRWTLEEISRHTCNDGSHFHLTWSDLYGYMLEGVTLEHVVSKGGGRRGVVKLHNLGRRLNDLSCKVGAPLVVAVEQRRAWALVMLDEILNGVTSV